MSIINTILKRFSSGREWSKGLGDEVVYLVKTLKREGNLGIILDCGAGEGRHSIYLAKEGARKVITVEADPDQIKIIEEKKRSLGLENIEIVNEDIVKYLETLPDESLDGIIDSGLSHCLTDEDNRKKFFQLAYKELKQGGLYSITHFGKKENLSRDHYKTTLEELKTLFSNKYWNEELKWHEASWARRDGKRHFAYKAVLRKMR